MSFMEAVWNDSGNFRVVAIVELYDQIAGTQARYQVRTQYSNLTTFAITDHEGASGSQFSQVLRRTFPFHGHSVCHSIETRHPFAKLAGMRVGVKSENLRAPKAERRTNRIIALRTSYAYNSFIFLPEQRSQCTV